jgi:5-(carboxyamino)imidazole ribonucleotide synthase
VTHAGTVLFNEMAPRPHNSGHWTIEAAVTSQFEQVIRAVMGWPLGSVDLLKPVEMINLLGRDIDNWESFLSDPHTKLHLYGKDKVVAGRKMGHITRLG